MHNISGLINMWNPLSSKQLDLHSAINSGGNKRVRCPTAGAARGHPQSERKSDEDPPPPFRPSLLLLLFFLPLHNQSRCLEPKDVRVWCMAENSWRQYRWDNVPSSKWRTAYGMFCLMPVFFFFCHFFFWRRPFDPHPSLCRPNNGWGTTSGKGNTQAAVASIMRRAAASGYAPLHHWAVRKAVTFGLVSCKDYSWQIWLERQCLGRVG